MDKILFPTGTSEDVRIQVCKIVEERDEEIRSLYKQIIKLESDLAKYNGALTYRQSEDLITKNNVLQMSFDSIIKELGKRHLKAVQYKDENSPNIFDFKIERVGYFDRFCKYLKSFIKFEIKLVAKSK